MRSKFNDNFEVNLTLISNLSWIYCNRCKTFYRNFFSFFNNVIPLNKFCFYIFKRIVEKWTEKRNQTKKLNQVKFVQIQNLLTTSFKKKTKIGTKEIRFMQLNFAIKRKYNTQ